MHPANHIPWFYSRQGETSRMIQRKISFINSPRRNAVVAANNDAPQREHVYKVRQTT